jgi:hypothetical protein
VRAIRTDHGLQLTYHGRVNFQPDHFQPDLFQSDLLKLALVRTLPLGGAADVFVLLALQLPELGHCHFQLELPLGIRIIHATDDHRLP